MPYSETDEIDRAVKLYFRQVREDGRVLMQQSNRDLTTQVGDVISIRSVRGELARYKVGPSGRLRTLQHPGLRDA